MHRIGAAIALLVATPAFAGRRTPGVSEDEIERPSEPSGELDWDMQAGPIVSLAVGRFARSATGGVSAWKTRTGTAAKLGAVGALGLGAAF